LAQELDHLVLEEELGRRLIANAMPGPAPIPATPGHEGVNVRRRCRLLGGVLFGFCRLNGAMVPLRLEPVTSAPLAKRPQLPALPLPYLQKEITFPSRADGVTLAGTFTIPRGSGPFPAVVLLSDSGPQDRDESISGHKPFLILADHLTRRGIAVVRFDDRGVGKSTEGPSPERVTTRDFALDAAGAVGWLAARKEVVPKSIGLIGHGEGGTVALLTVPGSPQVAFVVTLAGPALPGSLVLELQNERVARVAGASEAEVATARTFNHEAYGIVLGEPDDEAALARLEPLLERAGLPEERRKTAARRLVSPWFRFFLAHDPAEDLVRLRVPMLALYGEKDVQVVAAPHAAAAARSLDAAAHVDHTITVMPGLNHLFQECKTGDVSEYGAIEQTMALEALEAVGAWIERHAAVK
jgi:uncharacterized protein